MNVGKNVVSSRSREHELSQTPSARRQTQGRADTACTIAFVEHRFRFPNVVLERNVKMRQLVLLALVCLITACAAAGPASAKAPTLKRQFSPLNTRIQEIGEDAGAGLSAQSAWTATYRTTYFASLAKRTIAVSQAVGKLTGAQGALLVRQRRLQLALAQGATDLSALSTAARLHSAAKAKAAAQALVKDSPPINNLRSALSKALGLGV
jgi:hypothetical protein